MLSVRTTFRALICCLVLPIVPPGSRATVRGLVSCKCAAGAAAQAPLGLNARPADGLQCAVAWLARKRVDDALRRFLHTPYAPMVQCAHARGFAARWPACGDLWLTGEHVCASHTLPAKASSMASIQGLFAFLIHRRFGRGCTLNADVLRDVCSGAYAPWAVGCGFSMMIQAMAGGRRAARPMGGPACHASADSRYQAAPEHGERPEAPGTRCGHDIVLIERWHGGILA